MATIGSYSGNVLITTSTSTSTSVSINTSNISNASLYWHNPPTPSARLCGKTKTLINSELIHSMDAGSIASLISSHEPNQVALSALNSWGCSGTIVPSGVAEFGPKDPITRGPLANSMRLVVCARGTRLHFYELEYNETLLYNINGIPYSHTDVTSYYDHTAYQSAYEVTYDFTLDFVNERNQLEPYPVFNTTSRLVTIYARRGNHTPKYFSCDLECDFMKLPPRIQTLLQAYACQNIFIPDYMKLIQASLYILAAT